MMNSHSWIRAFLTLLVTCIAVIALSTSAQACGEMKGKKDMPRFSEIDKNADGALSADEFTSFRAERMASRAAEGRKMKNASKAPAFADLDLDDDGVLSAEEFDKRHALCPMKSGKHRKGHGQG